MTTETKKATSDVNTATRQTDKSIQLRPEVDIVEDAQGLTLYADLPGVRNDQLNVRVDKDTLLIEGEANLETPENMEALYADIRANRYRRSFTLSSELETEAIEARMKDGVLKLRIPKKAAVQPRKIDVRID